MKARIHWQIMGIEDSIVLEADTLEELQAAASREITKRGEPEIYWSNILEEQ